VSALHVGVFSPPLLLALAAREGRLADAGLEVETVPATSSRAQAEGLREAALDAAFTSPDNLLTYFLLPGGEVPVGVVAAIDRGLGLSLVLGPGVELADLAGSVVGVDVAGSGFAFVAYALLESHGVARDSYQLLELGATPVRARALIEGTCAATVLNAGNERWAEARGAALVARATELGPYLGTVLVAAHRGDERVARLGEVLVALAHEVRAGSYDDDVVELARERLALDEAGARAHLATLRSDDEGLVEGGRVGAAEVATLIGLRRRFAPTPTLDGAAAALLDLSAR
jgi:ABC-type nitrate/sulfonate/bicarbonate transport system substrate-binding protein